MCDLLERQLCATNKSEELMALYKDMFGIEDEVVQEFFSSDEYDQLQKFVNNYLSMKK